MRIFVKYNQNGEILSVSKRDSIPEGFNHPYGILREGEFAMEIPINEELLKMEASQIHTEFKVDIKKKKLLKKS